MTDTPNSALPQHKRRWFHVTQDRLLVGLLMVEICILVADRCHWIRSGEQQFRTTLIAIGIVVLLVTTSLVRLATAAILGGRHFQFSLRSLLLFATICAVACGWLTWRMKRKSAELEGVAAIVSAGGVVSYYVADEQPPGPDWLRDRLGQTFFSEAKSAQFFNDSGARFLRDDWLHQLESLDLCGWDEGVHGPISDAAMGHVDELTKLRDLTLVGAKFTDAGMVHIKGLSQLRAITIRNTAVSDAGMVNLEGLLQLQRLELYNARITDAGLVRLKGLTQLLALNLDRCRITDVGLTHLEGLTQLIHLSLDETEITDAGIVHLKGLTQLQSLQMRGTQVTEAGAENLHRALPNCEIGFGAMKDRKGIGPPPVGAGDEAPAVGTGDD